MSRINRDFDGPSFREVWREERNGNGAGGKTRDDSHGTRSVVHFHVVVSEVAAWFVQPSLIRQSSEVALISLLLKLITSTTGRCCSLNGFWTIAITMAYNLLLTAIVPREGGGGKRERERERMSPQNKRIHDNDPQDIDKPYWCTSSSCDLDPCFKHECTATFVLSLSG